jgi:hypothetical protein
MEENIIMTTQAPSFVPKDGVGTVWKDPSGKSWKYTPNGWAESGTESIVTDNKNKDTFVVKPEDTEIVNTLKGGGAKEEDIQLALKTRQEILATKQTETSSGMEPVIDEVLPKTIGKRGFDPFKGKTRTDVLRDAFNNGVTSSKELEELGKTYDILAVQETDEEQDLTKLSPAEQEVAKKTVEKQAVLKMQSLPDAVGRDSALSTLSTFRAGADIISTLESKKVDTGLISGGAREGVFGIGKRSLGKTTPEEDSFAALTEVFAANFRKAMSGTAVSEPEMRRLDKFLPSEKKTEQANIEGIIELSNYLSDKTSLQLGFDVSALKPQKANKDPLNLLGGSNNPKDNPLGI